MHKHQCKQCGCIWQHPETNQADQEMHTCPRCHTPLEDVFDGMLATWPEYRGDLPAEFTTPLSQGDNFAERTL